MKLFGDSRSDHCYKIQLTAALLDINYDWVDVDIMQGQTHSTEFLQMNPNGKIPLLQLNDGTCLSESNAIVNYLAWGTKLLPAKRLAFRNGSFLSKTVMSPVLQRSGLSTNT